MSPLDDLQTKKETSKPMAERLDWLNFSGFIRALEAVPTNKPQNISDQFVIVSGGGSTRAYLYDTAALAWKYWALT